MLVHIPLNRRNEVRLHKNSIFYDLDIKRLHNEMKRQSEKDFTLKYSCNGKCR